MYDNYSLIQQPKKCADSTIVLKRNKKKPKTVSIVKFNQKKKKKKNVQNQQSELFK